MEKKLSPELQSDFIQHFSKWKTITFPFECRSISFWNKAKSFSKEKCLTMDFFVKKSNDKLEVRRFGGDLTFASRSEIRIFLANGFKDFIFCVRKMEYDFKILEPFLSTANQRDIQFQTLLLTNLIARVCSICLKNEIISKDEILLFGFELPTTKQSTK